MRPLLLLFFYFLISTLLLCQAPTAVSVTCNPLELTPCAAAIMGSGAPNEACCAKLREQEPCFCQYTKNPSLRGYINSTNGKKVSRACKVPMPNC